MKNLFIYENSNNSKQQSKLHILENPPGKQKAYCYLKEEISKSENGNLGTF